MNKALWQYSTVHNSACKVIEEQTLWGQTVCRVWLPNQDAVVRVPRSALRPLSADLQPEIEAGRIAYVAAAAKVAEVLEGSTSATDGHVLLAPMESNVIPLPHQIHALSRAISGDRVRYLLADEVGLGKTIEAGLVMRELKLRGLVRRILVVSPKGIATQWVAEMQTHFNEQFQLVLGDDIGTLQRLAPGADHRSSAWSMFDQVIVSLDSVKPMDKRRGWTAERVAEYNRSRFEDLITAGWDLVVVDEAHRLGGSTDQVARYKLGKGLAEAAPYVLLLSATPHQGKTDAFHRLMNLLDDDAFPGYGQRLPRAGGPVCHPYREAQGHRCRRQAALQTPAHADGPGGLGEPSSPAAASLRGGDRLCARGLQPGPAREEAPHRLSDDPDAAPGGLQHPGDPHHAGTSTCRTQGRRTASQPAPGGAGKRHGGIGKPRR
jgi:hypothetical protein